MIHRMDERLLEEARHFRLVFACPDCASFDPGLSQEDRVIDAHAPRCSLGYPIAPHVDPRLDGRTEIVFCKAFELR